MEGLCPHRQPSHPERQGGAGGPQPAYLDPVGCREIDRCERARRGRKFLARVSSVIELRLKESGIQGFHHQPPGQEHLRHHRKTIMQNKSFDEMRYRPSVSFWMRWPSAGTLGPHPRYSAHTAAQPLQVISPPPSPTATRACTPPSSATGHPL